ncbi:MAG: 16S rRNA (guanine(966)-N(2))-methyltransferase RsmD [Gemmatimonadales bacterium]|nr:16S rRNA (guanine(966)-N(2))-methyltransferase RsmD [Gemmatimonadales bacterium]
MRIAGGMWRSRRIESPADPRARPTTDRVREAWMNILADRLAGARVVDLFAGSGAMGLEALSRGAAGCDFVELYQNNLDALGRNIEKLSATGCRLFRADALRFAAKLEPRAYDIAFADPPYTTGHASRIAALFRERRFARILGVEHEIHEDVGEGEHRRYGSTILTFLEAPDPEP